MSKRANDPEFRREVARQLRNAIEAKGLSRSEAANLLQIKRQTLWLYLNEKSTPGGEILKRACQLLGMTVQFKDHTFGPDAFAGATPDNGPLVHRQMDLFHALEELRSEQLETKVVGRVGEYFELKVRIRSTVK